MSDPKQESRPAQTGTIGHKAIFDITVSFRTESVADDKSARAFLEALTEFLGKVPFTKSTDVTQK